ncbi:aminodeoxychorismate lyase [Endozoicomonas sp. OPT23]|uniref:aminodeoxychorismate lyase n=1 Tax=Endozoicomonas sp. OPT23 TaxID=2072845 RepID=UPI00129B7C05|nr:aminodeoxychorismate lyase [Endozoicomonas sp. OPT23]MRI35219.1 aminodeoxychorismate lyase [Endozoicomonas sp. OPT23]
MSGYPVWVNGVNESVLPVTDRGLAYGDGLFETIRVVNGLPTLYDLHLTRLAESASFLGIDLSVKQLKTEVAGFLQAVNQPGGILKVILTRGSGGRGYNPAGCSDSSRILSFHDLPDYGVAPREQGIRLFPCETRLGQSVLVGMKHLNRLENVMARREWAAEAGCLEGLVQDFDGHIIEGTMSNLFFVQNGILKTPHLSRCGVKGVCREYILDNAALWGLKIETADYSFAELAAADEVFVCNSVNGVWPVTGCGNKSWAVGEVTCRVRDKLMEVINA